jgi:hypothetical protein
MALAMDIARLKIITYCTIKTAGTLIVIKLRLKIAEEGVHSPRGVAVHPGLGRVYWTDWDRYRPAIQMANMDGTGRQASLSMKFKKCSMKRSDTFSVNPNSKQQKRVFYCAQWLLMM